MIDPISIIAAAAEILVEVLDSGSELLEDAASDISDSASQVQFGGEVPEPPTIESIEKDPLFE